MIRCRVFFVVFLSCLSSTPFFASPCFTRGSRRSKRESSTRHLSDDFAWDSFPHLTQGLRSVLSSQSPPAASKSASSTSQIGEKHYSPESNKASLPPASSPPLSSAGLSRSPEDTSTLRLHMETQELEIKRLQLELQLAQLKLSRHCNVHIE